MGNEGFEVRPIQISDITLGSFSVWSFREYDFRRIIHRKNDLFFETIRKIRDFSSDRIKIISRILYDKESFLLFRFAVNRLLRRETKEFDEEVIDTWPKFYTVIWNDPSIQLIAVQERKEAFQQTEAVVNTMERIINSQLAQYHLRASFKPLFVKEGFWNIVENYKDRIKEIEFELITPNMANISGVLSEDLKELARNTNTSRTKIDVSADPDAALNISRNDRQVVGLVDYASEGGGSITVKVEGMKKKLRTADSTKTIEFSEALITGKSAEEIALVIKGFMT